MEAIAQANVRVPVEVTPQNKTLVQSQPQVSKEQLNETQNPKEAQTSKQDLMEIVQKLNSDTALNTKVKFGFHDESSTYFVSVRDAKTDEVLRKYPSDEAMSLAAKMRRLSRGLVDLQA